MPEITKHTFKDIPIGYGGENLIGKSQPSPDDELFALLPCDDRTVVERSKQDFGFVVLVFYDEVIW